MTGLDFRRSGPRSLALRLILYAAGWSIAALLVTGIVLSSVYRETVERNFDNYLGIFLKGLIANIEVSETGGLVLEQSLAEPRFDFPLSGWYWQVMRAKLPLQPVQASPSLLEFRLRLPHWTDQQKEAGERGYFMPGPDGRTLRVVEKIIILPGSDEKFIFTVAGDNQEILERIAAFNGTLVTALAILGLGLIAAVLLQVKMGLRPLKKIRDSLSAIRSGDEERLHGDFPPEIDPLVKELNTLLDYNHEVIERARTQVGNLAHALKTPLSVLTNEADANPGPFSRKVSEQTKVMRDQVNHYLDRARVAARANVIGANTPVEPVLEAILRVLNRVNQDKGIDASLECEEGLNFRGEQQDLEEMVGNLVDNAFKFARTTIKVSATRTPRTESLPAYVCISIEDDGPGLPEESLDSALKRGKRFDESKPGSGLGLSIVTDIATLYKGSFKLEQSGLGGLNAILLLPLAKQPRRSK
jgi:signal transduction histidine kinase